jgi:hypothetical protein
MLAARPRLLVSDLPGRRHVSQGMHLTDVHLMGVHPIGIYYLTGIYLTDIHLIGVYP